MERGLGGKSELSYEVASPDADEFVATWQGQISDAEDDSSQYSSCGGEGESEFERYCSANSAMGTPSVCSSIGTFHEFPDSLKLGDNTASVNNFGADKKLSDFRYGSSEAVYGKSGLRDGLLRIENGVSLYDNAEGSLMNELDRFDQLADYASESEVRGNSSTNESRKENENLGFNNGCIFNPTNVGRGEDNFHRSSGKPDCGLENLESESAREYVGLGLERFLNEDETSSRYEHSEGEDSMFGCGTDDEKKFDSHYGRDGHYYAEGQDRHENKLLMGSAIAFGSEDWDDFTQEVGDDAPISMMRDELPVGKLDSFESAIATLNPSADFTERFPSADSAERNLEMRDITLANSNIQSCDDLVEHRNSSFSLSKLGAMQRGEEINSFPTERDQVNHLTESADYLNTCIVSSIFETSQDRRAEKSPLRHNLETGLENNDKYQSKMDVFSTEDDLVSKDVLSKEESALLDPLSESVLNQQDLTSVEGTKGTSIEFGRDRQSYSISSLAATSPKMKMDPVILIDHFAPNKTKNFELNEFYDDFVHDMEEILLDSVESPGSRFTQVSRTYGLQIPLPSRDGGSTASTSGTDDAYHHIQQPPRIKRIEVIGARQKRGDVSFGERLVGVKEYTVYKIRVWSGDEHWEVERRYRDFYSFYRRLKKLFDDQGWTLPSPWSSVERESRKIFGNASPDIIADRSILIQECLRSILHSGLFSVPINMLISFLCPAKSIADSPASDRPLSRSTFSAGSTGLGNVSTMGKTISLIVHIRPFKSTKQMLDAQHYTCAGCHKNFDDGKTRIQELVQTLGWGKPRVCEYSGQLFCSSCHSNDTAVLPARVLHFWDFNQYPVSQLVKSYLDSIHDQPMLCVSAVNPFLFSKVPTLQHVTNIRKRIGAMLPYVRCPFRRSIYKGLGSRRYLLESNDFFALRDLIDLSKGVFAALPVIVETLSRKILDHISEQCLICYDAGIPCNARQACDDPSSLIFPFQEGEVERCKSCQSVFHKHCFKKVESCTCGVRHDPSSVEGNHGIGSEADGTLSLSRRMVDNSTGFLSGLFSKASAQTSRDSGQQRSKIADTLILMGQLPSTSL